MYGDLLGLLIPGFLSTDIDIEGFRVSLRSLSPQDLQYLRRYVDNDDLSWRYHLIAHSIWMVDGIPLLDVPYTHKIAYEALMCSNRAVTQAMLGTVFGFFSRVREAGNYLEAYLYEDESRRLWRGLSNGKHPLHSLASIPGIDRVGLNTVQVTWASWNVLEDFRDEHDSHWANTKILVALQSHKSYESLNKRDQLRAESEDGRRENVKERAWYRFQYGPPEETGERFRGETVHRARTNDELEDEMRRWIRGELDEHDQIVEEYKARVKQGIEEREREKERILQELKEQRLAQEKDLGVPKPALRAVTPEELRELMQAKGGPGSGAKFITEADPVSRAFNRFLRPEVKSGHLSVDAAGKIIETPPVVPDDAAPGPSLTEQIAARRVVVPDEVQS